MKKLISCLLLFAALCGLSALAVEADTETSLWPAYDPVTGLWGYIDEQGAWGIEPQYTWASHFHGGCAIVDMAEEYCMDTDTNGIIDENGEFLLAPEYYVFDFCEDDIGDIYFVMGFEDEEAVMGWFNIPNRFFSGLHWTECYATRDTPYILVNMDYELDGLADRATGEIVVPIEYSSTGLYDWGIDGGFIVAERDDTRACELIEIGRGVVELPEGVAIDYYPGVTEGLIAFKQDDRSPAGGLYGYLNTEGEIVIPAQYDSANDFRDGYAEVGLLEEVGTHAIIDRQGQVVLTGIGSRSSYGYNGMVAGALWVEWPDGTWGLVETDGTVRCRHTLPEEAYEVFWLYEFTEDGPIWVKYSMGDEEYAYGLISRDGAILVEPQWELPWGMMSADPQGWQAAGLDGKWGYLDAYGNTVLPFVYETADHFQGALARVRFDASTEGYINRAGEIVYQWPMP